MKKLLFIASFSLLVYSTYGQLLQKQLPPLAAESFRTGVEAYNRNRYGESIAQFERALSNAEDDSLMLYWLGKAYYKLGLSSSAFRHWREASDILNGSSFIDSRLELAGALEDPEGLKAPARYTRVTELSGKKDKTILFNRPSWIEPLSNGSFYLVSHGSNELLLIDVNGRIIKTLNGGTTGFDRPFACTVLDDGTIFLSEFQSNRIAKLSAEGKILGYLDMGLGSEKLAGPHYLASDTEGFIYVVDSGFSRVVKYNKEGQKVLSFGKPTSLFEGFGMPTGIAVSTSTVYVADMLNKAIYIFDFYGNYSGKLDIPALHSPEGLRIIGDRFLLVADNDRIIQIDLTDSTVNELYRSERKKPRILSAAYDANGELLAADFDASEIVYLSDIESRFSGLDIEIERINSDAFPEISFDVVVKDRRGNALSGLNISNFYASEGIVVKERTIEGDKPVDHLFSSIRSISSLAFRGAMDNSKDMDIIFLLEASQKNLANKKSINEAIVSIMNAAEGSATGRLIEAGRTPQAPSSPGISAMTAAVYKVQAQDNWRFDLGLRLAASTLFSSDKRKAIIYIGNGDISNTYWEGSTLSELASLLYKNNIVLYSIIGTKSSVSGELEYLSTRSGGKIFYLNSPYGFSSIPKSIQTKNTGRYRLSFYSGADDGFGKSYLPLSIEVYLRDRSGKDESGYFAPLR